jgi:O-antigen/teichoic acid export membrane protein
MDLNRPIILWAGEFLRIGTSFLILRELVYLSDITIAGQYLSIIAVVMLTPRLLDFGLPQAIVYFTRAHKSKGSILARLIFFHITLASLGAVILAWLLQFFPFESPEVVRLVCVYWPLLAVIMVAELVTLLGLSTFIPVGLYAAHATTNLAQPITILTGLFLIGNFKTSPLEAGQLLFLFSIASMVGMLVMILGAHLGHFSYGSKTFSTKKFYRYAIHSYGSGVSKLIAQRLDRIMLTILLSSAGYAHYSIAVSMRDLCMLPANLNAQTSKNVQMDLGVSNYIKGKLYLYKRALFWFFTCLGFGLFLLPWWPMIINLLFKANYLDTVEALSILAFSCAPMSVYAFCLNHLYAIDRPGYVTAISLLSLCITILMLWGGSRLVGGVSGAALAVTICSFLNAFIALVVASTLKPSVYSIK